MRLLLSAIVACLMLGSAEAQSPRRVALVIGNEGYVVGPARLARPHEDARLVHQALTAAGFDAGETPMFDLEKPAFEDALRDFAREARHAEAAVVYYAGHAIHALNETWLIPIGARLELQDDIRTEGIRLSDVVAIARRDGLSIVFLDACRDNPFASYRNAGGLPVMPPPEGSVVAYAAAAGHPAPDDGAYARALATRMQEEGVELRQFLNRVATDVRRARNVPAELAPVAEIQLANTNHFYFRGGPPPAGASTPTPAALTYVSPERAPDARQTPADVRAPLVRGEDVSRLQDFALFRECEACPEMVVLPAGRFMMGSPDSESGRTSDEGPQRQVSVRRFAIGRFEVTGAEWSACVDADGGCFEGILGRRRVPVANVSWNDLPAYFNWLNSQAGGGTTLVSAGGGGRYRLASEAEWEYAARAGTTTVYAFGDDVAQLGEYAWFDQNAERRTHEVGGKRANRFGLYDLHGNLWEWTQDCEAWSSSGLPRDGSAHETSDCSDRVLRGGSWGDLPRSLRSAERLRLASWARGGGFRVARTL